MDVPNQPTKTEKEYINGLADKGVFDDEKLVMSPENGMIEWSQVCREFAETLDEDVKDMAIYWLLEACPKYAEYLVTKIVLPNGNTIVSSTPTDNDDRHVLQIRKPNELFREFNNLISAFRSSDIDGYANQDDLTLISSALNNTTDYDLQEKPVEYIQRYIQHIENMGIQKEPVVIGDLSTLNRTLAITVRPASLYYETPTSVDFSLLPKGYEKATELWNSVARKISFFPSLLNAEELAVSFMLHKVRYGVAQEETNGQMQPVAYIYAVQKENEFYTEVASRNPERLLAKSKKLGSGLHERWLEKISDLMAFAEEYPSIVVDVLDEDFFPKVETSLGDISILSVRSYLKAHPDIAFHDYEKMNPQTSSYLRVPGRIEVVNLVKALRDCEEALEIIPELQVELSKLNEAYKNNDKMLYELDQGLPRVTEEERAFKSSRAKAQAGISIDEIYDPESTRMVPRAGFAGLICAISVFHANGIREIKIPTFMPFRWIGHTVADGEDAAAKIHYATTNVLMRMAIRVTEQIKGAHLISLGEGDQMLKIHLDKDLSSDNPVIQDVIDATKTSVI